MDYLVLQAQQFKFISFLMVIISLKSDSIFISNVVLGQSNPTFMVTTSEGKKFTVRKQPPGKLLPGAHAVDREYFVMEALKHTNVKVPNCRLFCNNTSVIGSPFFVYGT